MIGGIINIIVGLLCVGLGLSGKFVLIGTQSSIPLVAVGSAVAAYGVFRIIRERRGRR
jgi:hypothetical protein